MKHLKLTLAAMLLSSFILTSCDSNDDSDGIFDQAPTALEFQNIRAQALENETQHFQFNAEDGWISLTTENGVVIGINGSCLTKNGDPVTGMVDLEYVELFEKGKMLTTNKPTMGVLPGGEKALLISGGEFFMEATQDGVELETTCTVQLQVPTSLTSEDNDMILWNGTIDEEGDLAWEEADAANGQGGVFVEGGSYYAFLSQFGWSNIDRFYNDPRPKTTIYAQAPTGYDYTNSAIYLSYDGEDTGLAQLDTYEDGLFSEHYGQIPIGLECHVIFITEEDGNWRYAVKAVTIAENEVITFTLSETDLASESELIAIINNLP